jgi:hypothetical protein
MALPLAVTRAMFRTVVSTGAVPVTWVTPQAEIHLAPSAALPLLLHDKPDGWVLLPVPPLATWSDSELHAAAAITNTSHGSFFNNGFFKTMSPEVFAVILQEMLAWMYKNAR